MANTPEPVCDEYREDFRRILNQHDWYKLADSEYAIVYTEIQRVAVYADKVSLAIDYDPANVALHWLYSDGSSSLEGHCDGYPCPFLHMAIVATAADLARELEEGR